MQTSIQSILASSFRIGLLPLSAASRYLRPEVESRTQDSKPRTQKNPRSKPSTALLRTDTLEAKDRNARDQGQRPRTQTQAFPYPKKEGLQKIFFRRSPQKKQPRKKTFSVDLQTFNHSKNSAVLNPRTGQFLRTWDFEVKDVTFEAKVKAKDFKMCPRGRPRGQGRSRGLQLCLRSHCLDSCSCTRLFGTVLTHFRSVW